MEALTRRHFRERVRHNLNKRTLRDSNPQAVLGEPAPTHPWPSNAFLNEKIDDAIAKLNAECDLGFSMNEEIEVAAASEDGEQRVELSGSVNIVKRAYWEVSGTFYPLTQVDREEFDRTRRQRETADAGTPRYLWREGNDLFLYPGTDTAGTLHFSAGTGIIGFTTDNDTLLQLPNDYHIIAVDLVTELVAETQQQDTEMASYAALYHAKVWGDGRQDIGGIGRIRRWKRGQTAETQAHLFVRTGRVAMGRRG